MLSFKLIPALFMLLAAIDTTLAAPSNLVARTHDGCYMVLTPNPTTKMLVGVNPGGKYSIEIKFGDGGGGATPREPAYKTHNPAYKFADAKQATLQGCGKGLETKILKELHGRKGALVVPSATEWYTLNFGSNSAKSRTAYGVLEKQMEQFSKWTFNTEPDSTAWADQFIKAIEPLLSDV